MFTSKSINECKKLKLKNTILYEKTVDITAVPTLMLAQFIHRNMCE